METHELSIRVRYAETDQMAYLHHANYIVYFEMGRTELLRARGLSDRELEDQGVFLEVVKLSCRYRKPGRDGDLLTLRTTLVRTTHVRIEHRYELFRGDTLLAEGESTLACVDREGKLQALPEILRGE